MIRGYITLYMRHGLAMQVPAEVADDAAGQKLVAELAEDVNRAPLLESDHVFQLRPGLWVRRREVVGVAFQPVVGE